MIVDTHVHVGIWSGGNCSVEEVLANVSAAGVASFVQVTNSNVGWDNGPSLACADEHPERVLGVVGRFEPSAPDVPGRLRAYMSHPRMIGMRVQPKPPNPEGLRSGMFDPTIAAAAKLGVPIAMFAPFEVSLMHEKVRRFSEGRFLIDHMGLDSKAKLDEAGTFAQWPELLKLAQEPNVWIKVSHFPQAVASISIGSAYPMRATVSAATLRARGRTQAHLGFEFPFRRPGLHLPGGAQKLHRRVADCEAFSRKTNRRDPRAANFLEHFIPARLQPPARR